MTAKGHVALASVIAYFPIEYLSNSGFNITTTIGAYFFIIFGSLLPDIDEPKSYIGNKFYLLSKLLTLLGLKHRTLTHWFILPSIIISVGVFIDIEIVSIYVISLGIGIIAHDVGDMLTIGGIKGFFYPFFPNTKIVLLPNFLRFQTFSFEEYLFILFLIFLNTYLYLKDTLVFLKDMI